MFVVPSSALATTSPAVLTVLVPLALRRGGMGGTFMAPIPAFWAAVLLGARQNGGTVAGLVPATAGLALVASAGARFDRGGRLGRGRGVGVRPLHGDPAP